MAHTQRELDDMDMSEAVDAWLGEKANYNVEGRRGVVMLCKLARTLGYNDPQQFGQMTSGPAFIGDLIEMLQDNSGMVEAMVAWIGKQRSPEWLEGLKGELEVSEEDSEEETEP